MVEEEVLQPSREASDFGMRGWPLSPTRDAVSGSLVSAAETPGTASSKSGAGSAPQLTPPITPMRFDLKRKLEEVKTTQEVNRALHNVAGQRFDVLTESVNQLRAELRGGGQGAGR